MGLFERVQRASLLLDKFNERVMHANAYLMFKGNCEEAFRYYAKLSDGSIEMMLPHKGTPAEGQTPPEWQNKIIHARHKIGNTLIMASDVPPGHQHKEMSGFYVSLEVDMPTDAERIFSGLCDGAPAPFMQMQETFFAKKLGMIAHGT